jgi:hypothetical protein
VPLPTQEIEDIYKNTFPFNRLFGQSMPKNKDTGHPLVPPLQLKKDMKGAGRESITPMPLE